MILIKNEDDAFDDNNDDDTDSRVDDVQLTSQCPLSPQWQFANESELKASSEDIERSSLPLSAMSQGGSVFCFVMSPRCFFFIFCIL